MIPHNIYDMSIKLLYGAALLYPYIFSFDMMFYDVFIVFYLLQRRRVNAIARDVCLSVCLSVCKQDYSKTRVWIWMTFCVSKGIGTWTN